MLEEPGFYDGHNEECHIYLEADKRNKVYKERVDSIFNHIYTIKDLDLRFFADLIELHNEYDKALVMYGLGFETSCIVEIYGLLEVRLIQYLGREFENVQLSKRLEKFIYEKKIHFFALEYFLRYMQSPEIARILYQIGALDKKDVKFIGRLFELRNAIVHKNMKQLEKWNKSKKDVHIPTLDTKLTNFDAEEIFLNAIIVGWHLAPAEVKDMVKKDRENLIKERAQDKIQRAPAK
jgi:hypothetical protein